MLICLSACPRFKSLQQRGIIEPRVVQKQRKGRRVAYETGARFERARAEQDAVNDSKRKKK